MITLTINGRHRELEGPTRLIVFLQASGIDLQFIAVAHNGEVVDRESFPQIVLDEGDEIEVVRPVGGG
ncbi:MAG: sulfur carrier protein ThiS [Dehalococcoidia bacterium]|nr:sulfur carrier protein ThiS [Dehalococcoidia bacterium]